MDEARLPAHLEVNALIRRAGAEGGFASVIRKGEQDAGTILLILTERGANPRVFERMPQPDGARKWILTRIQNTENKQELEDWLTRRADQDQDLWIVELDIANGERLIGLAY
ncbi:MAG: DUF1491 family protein [Novosphingobium sp.]|jgi:hypothetical protein|nr:DUF1491 family protein [Novosphingobium sp.]